MKVKVVVSLSEQECSLLENYLDSTVVDQEDAQVAADLLERIYSIQMKQGL